MTGIKNTSKRAVTSVRLQKPGNPRQKPAAAPRAPVLNHFEARARQLAKVAQQVAAAVSKAAKGNDKPGSPTGVYKPMPPPSSGASEFEACSPHQARPAVLTHSTDGEVVPVKGNGGSGRGTITRAGNFCTDEGAPETVLV